jgi:hypothetical protein
MPSLQRLAASHWPLATALLLLAACAPATPFPGANPFADPGGRYSIVLISPPWALVPEGLNRLDVPAGERVDFAVFTDGFFGSLPEPVPVVVLSIFPPTALGGLDQAVTARRNELVSDLSGRFSLDGEPLPFSTDDGTAGLEFFFLESGFIFHREFFFQAPDGSIARLLYASARDLRLPELEAMTRTFSFSVNID